QAGLDGAEKVARRMTLGTVAGSVHQIGAPVPVVGLLRVGLKRQAVQEQQLPDADQAADVERKGQLMLGGAALNRRQRLEIGKQVAQVIGAHALVGRVGERRIKML